MEFLQQFRQGDNIKIFLSKDCKCFYNSKILEIHKEQKEFVIEFNEKDLICGDLISVKSEQNEHIFMFCTKVVDALKGNYRVTLEMPKEINRLNKKDFFSLPLNLQIDVKNSRNIVYTAESNEISDIGLSLGMNDILNIDETVKMTIPLYKDFILEDVKGIVKKIENGKNLNFKYFIAFDSLDNRVSEQLLAYIFKVQKILLQISKNM